MGLREVAAVVTSQRPPWASCPSGVGTLAAPAVVGEAPGSSPVVEALMDFAPVRVRIRPPAASIC